MYKTEFAQEIVTDKILGDFEIETNLLIPEKRTKCTRWQILLFTCKFTCKKKECVI